MKTIVALLCVSLSVFGQSFGPQQVIATNADGARSVYATDMLYEWLGIGSGNQLGAINAGVTSIRFVDVGGFYNWIAY